MRRDRAVTIALWADLAERAEDGASSVTQDEVAELPHHFYNEPNGVRRGALSPARETDLDEALPHWLPKLTDAGALEVLAQEHHKRGRLGHQLARLLLHQVDTGELGMRPGQ